MSQRNINRLFVHSILLCFTLLPVVGNALDLAIEPRFQAGVMDYQFEQKPVEFTTPATGKSIDHGFKIVSVLPFVGGGVTLLANRFFFDGNYSPSSPPIFPCKRHLNCNKRINSFVRHRLQITGYSTIGLCIKGHPETARYLLLDFGHA